MLVFIIAPRTQPGQKGRQPHQQKWTRNNSSLYLYLFLYLCLYLYLYLYFLYLYLQKGTRVDSGPATVPYFLGMLPTLGSLVINTIAFLILAVQKYVSQIIPDINLILQTNDKVLEPKLSLICLQLVPRCPLQCHNSHLSSNLEYKPKEYNNNDNCACRN